MVGVTIQTANTKRVTGKTRTRKNRQNLVGKYYGTTLPPLLALSTVN